jgi:hypothetical protein
MLGSGGKKDPVRCSHLDTSIGHLEDGLTLEHKDPLVVLLAEVDRRVNLKRDDVLDVNVSEACQLLNQL